MLGLIADSNTIKETELKLIKENNKIIQCTYMSP